MKQPWVYMCSPSRSPLPPPSPPAPSRSSQCTRSDFMQNELVMFVSKHEGYMKQGVESKKVLLAWWFLMFSLGQGIEKVLTEYFWY